jgi:hypothetical protein
MAGPKAEKITLLNGYPLAEHTCPVTRIKYLGECAVLTCPANISRLQENLGGCFLQNVSQPTEVEVGRFLHLTTKEVQQRYRRGINAANNFLEFYNWLQDYRELAIKKPGCRRCGIATVNGKDCLNMIRCQRRQKIIRRANKQYLRISLLDIKPQEFWAIVAAQQQDKIHRVLSRRDMRRANKAAARLNLVPPVRAIPHADFRQNSSRTYR